ncbi:MAG: hypothetical protein HGA36_02095 [Candidatus Moranbacteria bacterium]|nr:hypothetical protein [Candidatus Moranbacteria bacterium]
MPIFSYPEKEVFPETIAKDLGLKIIDGAYYLNNNHVDHVVPGIFFILDGEATLLQVARELPYLKEQIFPRPESKTKSR